MNITITFIGWKYKWFVNEKKEQMKTHYNSLSTMKLLNFYVIKLLAIKIGCTVKTGIYHGKVCDIK